VLTTAWPITRPGSSTSTRNEYEQQDKFLEKFWKLQVFGQQVVHTPEGLTTAWPITRPGSSTSTRNEYEQQDKFLEKFWNCKFLVQVVHIMKVLCTADAITRPGSSTSTRNEYEQQDKFLEKFWNCKFLVQVVHTPEGVIHCMMQSRGLVHRLQQGMSMSSRTNFWKN
jgi:hypothetical protein